MALTLGQAKTLLLLRNHYEYGVNHPITKKFREEMKEAYGFYDGDGHWTDGEKAEILERGQNPVVNNKIKPAINSVSGREIQTRFRTAYRATSDDKDHELLAKALTYYSYGVFESQHISYKQSIKFRDKLICGLGWSQQFKDGENIIYEYVHPSLIIPDPDDLSPQFTNSSNVCRTLWLSLPAAQSRFKKHARDFEQMASDFRDSKPALPNGYGEIEERNAQNGLNYVALSGQSARLRIVEVQYKKSATIYTAWDERGHLFETFDRDAAREIAVKKSEIEEREGQRVMYGFYTGDILIEHDALKCQPVNIEDFSYIPSVYSRRFSDGVPQGIVRDAQDAQKEYNKRRSKMLDLITRNLTTVGPDAADAYDREFLRKELNNPNAVIFAPPGSVQRQTFLDIAMGHFELLRKCEDEIQHAMGIFGEALGRETNAQSGVAIQQRQVNSVNNQIFAFDSLKLMKEREARYLLGLIQASRDPNRLVKIPGEDGEHEVVVFNKATADGKIYESDIASVPIDLVIEEVKDYQSGPQETAENVIMLLQHPETYQFLTDETVLNTIGVREARPLARAFQKAMSGQGGSPEEQKVM